MKKLLLSFTLFALCYSSQAQNFCPPGATWYYRNFNPNIATYFDGTLKLSYTGTATVNNVACKLITGTFYGRSQWQDPNTYTVTNYVTYRTYEANNVVYLFNVFTQHFDTIVNYNAHIGDSWSYVLYNSFCDDQHIARSKVTVYDTGHVVINGVSLKKLVVSPLSTPSPSVILERISCMPGFLFMKQDCDQDGSTLGDFSCYSDSTFPTYSKPGIVTCIFNTVSIQEQTLASGYVKLYPNPSNGAFTVELTQACTIEVYNNLGAPVRQSIDANEGLADVSLNDLPAGIYYLKAFNAKGSAHLKVMKQ